MPNNYKTIKIRFYPNSIQKIIINDIFNGCRFARNKYIEYINANGFISYKSYSKIFNRLKLTDDDYKWISEYGISTKAITDSFREEEMRWKRFFKKKHNNEKCKKPTFLSKKKSQNHQSYYFIHEHVHIDNVNGNHLIKIPILGKVRITTDKNKLPLKENITSGYVVKDYNKYYIVFRYTYEPIYTIKDNTIAYGIDLGIKSYATIACRDGNIIHLDSYLKDKRYKTIKSKIKNLQRILSNKVEFNYGRLLHDWMNNRPNEKLTDKSKNKLKGESYNTSNVRKLQKKINLLHIKLVNIRKDYIYKFISSLVVITKHFNTIIVPKYISIEDLHVSELLQKYDKDSPRARDRFLHSLISESAWYFFKTTLQQKCYYYNVELRESLKYFASSKKCCICGKKNHDLTLANRIFKCNCCGNTIDRDENAAINLLNMDKRNYISYIV